MNEIFALVVETGNETLELQVYDKDDYGKDDFLGSFSLTLDQFRD